MPTPRLPTPTRRALDELPKGLPGVKAGVVPNGSRSGVREGRAWRAGLTHGCALAVPC